MAWFCHQTTAHGWHRKITIDLLKKVAEKPHNTLGIAYQLVSDGLTDQNPPSTLPEDPMLNTTDTEKTVVQTDRKKNIV